MGGFLPDPDGAIGAAEPVFGVSSRLERVELLRTPPIVQWWQDCVAVSIADAYLFELLVSGDVPEVDRALILGPGAPDPATYERWLPSRRKLYWDARAVMGTIADGGTRPSAIVSAIADKGVCAERWCPYDGAPEENPLADHDDAGRMSMDQAGRIELRACVSFDDVIAALASGHRVLYASYITSSMQDVGPESFYVPSGPRIGAHMWQLVGFEDRDDIIRMKNQWPGWGDDNQEAYAARSTLESSMMTALVFHRTARYSENDR